MSDELPTATQLLIERKAHVETIRQRDILATALRVYADEKSWQKSLWCWDGERGPETAQCALREAGMEEEKTDAH